MQEDYKVIIKFPQADFEADVNQALKDGYDLVGGVTTDHMHGWYCQAVAKHLDSFDLTDYLAKSESPDSDEAKTEVEKSVSLTHEKGKKGGKK